MGRILPLTKTLITVIIPVIFGLASPLVNSFIVDLDDAPRLTPRSRGAGAQCATPLLSTVAQNTDQDDTAQYRICCPASTPDGMKILGEVVCCKRVTDSRDPEGCTAAAGTLVLPASVKGCDRGWDKKELMGIKYCVKKT